ncbi:MAG: BolA family protein [Polaromonas sp.]
MTSEELRALIAASLPCEHLEVSGDGSHWYATIVSSAFDGLSRIERHRRGNAAVGDRIHSGEVHALSMKTFTPAEWAALNTQ